MMNFYTMLQKRASKGRPLKVGVIGAGKFSAMFLSHTHRVPGLQVMGIAELEPQCIPL
jgi:predicted homoserine dehydrogenase-like protein